MNKSESIAELAKALAAFQGEVKQPMKDRDNPFFKSKYVPLENVVEAITNIAPKHGLSFIQYPINQESKVGIVTILMHSSGEYLETQPIFAKPAKDDAQATGSVITYLKRYALSAVFGITSDEDDDGNAATNQTKQQNNQQQQRQQSSNAPNLLSEPQKKKLNVLIGQMQEAKELSRDEVVETLKSYVGPFESITQLTKGQASTAINRLETALGGQS